MSGDVTVLLPGQLREDAGGRGQVEVPVRAGAVLGDVLAALAASHPLVGRRVLDEAGAIRRHVNAFVDGDDVRQLAGLRTPVPAGAEVHLIPSVAGG